RRRSPRARPARPPRPPGGPPRAPAGPARRPAGPARVPARLAPVSAGRAAVAVALAGLLLMPAVGASSPVLVGLAFAVRLGGGLGAASLARVVRVIRGRFLTVGGR